MVSDRSGPSAAFCERAEVAAGKQDGEPGHDHHYHGGNLQEGQRNIVRDGQQPFHQRQPPIQVKPGIGVRVVQADRLMVVPSTGTGHP